MIRCIDIGTSGSAILVSDATGMTSSARWCCNGTSLSALPRLARSETTFTSMSDNSEARSSDCGTRITKSNVSSECTLDGAARRGTPRRRLGTIGSGGRVGPGFGTRTGSIYSGVLVAEAAKRMTEFARDRQPCDPERQGRLTAVAASAEISVLQQHEGQAVFGQHIELWFVDPVEVLRERSVRQQVADGPIVSVLVLRGEPVIDQRDRDLGAERYVQHQRGHRVTEPRDADCHRVRL